jgi:peptide/nickel transport system ATP-binding protein
MPSWTPGSATGDGRLVPPRRTPLTAPLIDVRDLRVHFETDDGLVKAVDGISYSLAAGSSLGIVGESGSGKSVSSLTLMGLTRAATTRVEGEVVFEGRDLLTAPEAELRAIRGDEIAMVFQDPLSSLHPLYRVGTQLVEAVRAHRDVSRAAALDRSAELLGLVGIPDPRRAVRAYPHQLSGGMRQRAMIAMALVNEPRLLIADEPTTALDVTVQAQILDLIERLRRELGMAVLVITHDLGVVAEVAQTVAVMYAGRIVEQAPVATLFEAPQHPYTWGLLGSVPRLDARRGEALTPIPGRPPSLIERPGGCAFHPRCPYVRAAHRRVQPALEPVPGADEHHVACLLPVSTRRRLWSELRAGAGPEAARERAERAEREEASA